MWRQRWFFLFNSDRKFNERTCVKTPEENVISKDAVGRSLALEERSPTCHATKVKEKSAKGKIVEQVAE